MKDYSLIIEDLRQKISADFLGTELSFDSKTISLGTVHCFVIKLKNSIDLKDNWKKITNLIALQFQSQLTTQFEKWNVYLFFMITDNQIQNDLKYLIENDTFSSRKIVIPFLKDIDSIIDEFVTNTQLKVQQLKKTTELKFEPNDLLWNHLRKMTAKQKMSEEHTKSLDKIINQLKKEEDEI